MTYKIKEAPFKKQKDGLTFSHSSISVMEKCHREYFLQYIAKVRVPDDAPHSAFGSMLHLIAENYKGEGQDEIKGLFQCFQTNPKLKKKYWDKLDDIYRGKIIQALKNLYRWMKNRRLLVEDYKPEIQIDVHNIDKVDDKDIHLQGKLDGFYFYKDKTFITDFKTGKKRKDHAEQLGFYFYMLSKVNPAIVEDSDVVGEIVNISLEADPAYDDGVVEYYELEEYDIIHAEKRVERAIATLRKNGISKDDINNWKKKPQKLCDWCKFKKSGKCDGKHDSFEDKLESLERS